ncbi:MAG: ABC transporter ATP-binding protein, partial [Roseiflexaceae bacterium]|nr:ABC transporter ATP-binding protein [Roseiflexaceae bacterium]
MATTVPQREFTITGEYEYDRRTPTRWVLAHVWRYPWLPIVFVLTVIGMAVAQSFGAISIGRAFDALIGGGGAAALGAAALWVTASYLGYGAFDIVNSLALRVLGQRVER